MVDTLMVLTTMPDAESAERLASRLVEAGLAACVNVGPEVVSVYSWKGEMQRGSEVQLTIKTVAARYNELEEALTRSHPYEVPEILAVPVANGLPAYLDWVKQCTSNC